MQRSLTMSVNCVVYSPFDASYYLYYFILKVPDMIHNIITHPFFFSNHPWFFSNHPWFWYQRFCHIFLTFVLKFGVNIPNTLGEINRNVAWKLESVITTLNKTINNKSTIFSYYFLMRLMFPVCSLWVRYLDENRPYLHVLARLIFQNFHVRHL